MPEMGFLDRLGDEFRAAVVMHHQLQTAPKRRLRRGGLIALAGLAVAGPALAVVQPWNPTLGRPGIDEPVSTSGEPVVADAKTDFAILRRTQTATDRQEAAPLLTAVAQEVSGVQTDSIRSLGRGWALVPVTSLRTGVDRAESDALCITDGETIACGPAATASKNGIAMTSAAPSGTRFSSLVPDGVARVRFTPDGGTPVEVDATSNFVTLSVPDLQPAHLIRAPEGYDGPSMIPGPPIPVDGTVEWIDQNGRVVGPAQKRR